MNKHDNGHGRDVIGVHGNLAVAERAYYKSEWGINKFDAEEHERKVKPLIERAAEFMILSQHFQQLISDAARSGRQIDLEWVKKMKAYRQNADDLNALAEGHAFDSKTISGNLLLNEGINNAMTLICGGAATAYNNTNARLGVGDSSTAEAATQTDLQAATNKLYKAMDASYPTYGTSQQAVWRSTFGSTDANYAWAEFTVDNGAVALLNLNRKVSAQGTKASGQTWTLTLTITLS